MVSDSEAQWSLRSNFGRQSGTEQQQKIVSGERLGLTLESSNIVDKYWWSFSGRSKINECKVLAQDRYTR
uniref:Uncharacterized protein n=1 Tax=Romanomermis culicivorax TaxID=13658 RepID=A0A915KFY1_ROMCU